MYCARVFSKTEIQTPATDDVAAMEGTIPLMSTIVEDMLANIFENGSFRAATTKKTGQDAYSSLKLSTE